MFLKFFFSPSMPNQCRPFAYFEDQDNSEILVFKCLSIHVVNRLLPLVYIKVLSAYSHILH